MKQAILDLLQSKKFLAALLSILVWSLGRAGLQVSADQLMPIVGSLWAYIVGQGIADNGKEREKAKRSSASRGD